jgi:magnesium-transporting ATPase (P-type)
VLSTVSAQFRTAAERLIELCVHERHADGERPIDAAAWQDRIDALAAQGQRVLAVANHSAGSGQRSLGFEHVGRDLTLLGLFGLMDPPRQEAVGAVRACVGAGIRVK